MASIVIQVCGLSQQARDELAERAARRGQSLTAYLRDLLEREAATPDVPDVFARVEMRSESSPVTSVNLIRADRDRR